MGIRLLVVDDNPHLRWHGRVYPVNATFHRFLSAFLDLPGEPVASIAHAVPLRELPDNAAEPVTLAVDPRIRTVATAPFDGIAGYLRGAARILRANGPLLAAAVQEADLVWIKVPASNALLAGWVAWRAGVPRFGYVAGSALAVARGRGMGLPAQAVGFGYDSAGRLAGGRHRMVVGRGIVDGNGIVTSLIETAEIRDPGATWPREPGRLEIVWAGRLTSGKGLETVLEALGIAGPEVHLSVLGDGPDRERLRTLAGSLGVDGRVRWCGYVADRALYLDELAAADLFVFPSPAEGFPKVLLDAFAVGVPVLATRAGALLGLVEADLVEPIDPLAAAVAAAWDRLRTAGAPTVMERIRRGHAFVERHTRPSEATRLVGRWRTWWPDLSWER